MSEEKDVVILGGGLAGLTAAYQLRDRDIVVLEREDRVGGRTFSGEWQGYWYNAGAQFVWDHRTLAICEELGIDLLDAKGAHSAVYMRGKLVSAPHPYLLFLKMPLSLRERIDFARTILKLRRIAGKYPNVDRLGMDAKSLAEIMGDVTPITREILDRVVESAMALSTDEVSGYIGLSYAIHVFGGDANEVLKAVVGGTQQITKGLRGAVGAERVLLGCRVTAVKQEGEGVVVAYQRDGREETVRAKACVAALPAGDVLEVVQGLPDDKREALKRMSPSGKAVSVAVLTNEEGPAPWDKIVVMPVLGRSFELLSNNAHFVRRRNPERKPGGTMVAIATMERAEALWDLPDEEVGRRVTEDLREMFPQAGNVVAGTVVNRWRAFPPFRPGALRDQEALRRPLGRIHFAGDYTAQPGTPGAVGSGYHTSRAVRRLLEEGAGGG